LLLDFSVSFLGTDSRALITDPAYGASLVSISRDNKFSVDKKVVITGEKATCWSVYSSRFNTVFIIDGGSPTVTLVDPFSGDIRGTIPLNGPSGGLDTAADREYLYVLRGGAFVSVIDNRGLNNGKTPRETQTLDLSALGSRQGFMGMAVYPS
jgi:hypothetical protein